MMKICITGSISSGKTTATKIISNNKGPIFRIADRAVKKFILEKKFKNIVAKKMGLKTKSNFKTSLKKNYSKRKENLRRLENCPSFC